MECLKCIYFVENECFYKRKNDSCDEFFLRGKNKILNEISKDKKVFDKAIDFCYENTSNKGIFSKIDHSLNFELKGQRIRKKLKKLTAIDLHLIKSIAKE